MVDLHCHILPWTDDGSVDMEMTLKMLKIAKKGGTDTIAATPHFAPGFGFENPCNDILMSEFEKFRQMAKKEGIQAFLGQEVFYTAEIARLLKEKLAIGLNFSHFLLTEFDFSASAIHMLEGIDEIAASGYFPVIAHPERYDEVVDEPYLVEEMRQCGAVCQINAGSVTGMFGKGPKRAAMYLLDQGWVDVIASDGHKSRGRTPDMTEAFQFTKQIFGRDAAHRLFDTNPRSILEDKYNNEKV